MKKRNVFLFDLDSTITTVEILPTIAKKINKEKEMKDLTEKTMIGTLNFEESFTLRVNILKDISVSEVSEMISKIPLSEKLVKFLKGNKDNCYIVTGNLDVWIDKLMKRIGMENNVYCSNALVKDGTIKKISKILAKEEAMKNFKDCNIIAIGDGSNDRKMLENADVSIGYGGVREIAPTLLEVADYAIYDEDKLYEFLNRLV